MKDKEQSEEKVQIKFYATPEQKALWEAKAGVEGKKLNAKIIELIENWHKGEKQLTKAERERQEEKELEAIRKYDEDMKYARSWPVGEPRKVSKDEIKAGTYPSTARWVDEVGNLFDKDFSLVDKNGDEVPGQGGGRLVWEKTWQPAILGGWRAREEDVSVHTKTRWPKVVYAMIDLGRLPKEYTTARAPKVVVAEEEPSNG